MALVIIMVYTALTEVTFKPRSFLLISAVHLCDRLEPEQNLQSFALKKMISYMNSYYICQTMVINVTIAII